MRGGPGRSLSAWGWSPLSWAAEGVTEGSDGEERRHQACASREPPGLCVKHARAGAGGGLGDQGRAWWLG